MATTTAATTAVAGRGKKGSKRTVLIQTEKKCQNDRQTAAAEYVRAENSVFRAENKQCDKNPKGGVTR